MRVTDTRNEAQKRADYSTARLVLVKQQLGDLKMNESIREELKEHVKDLIADGFINQDNIEDAHYHAFSEDYYIIGHWNAEQWLEKHDVTAWEAIQYVIEQDTLMHGLTNITTDDCNPERIVNLLVYYAGYELNLDQENINLLLLTL